MIAGLSTPRYRLFADLIALVPRIQELADDLDALFRDGYLTVSRDDAGIDRFTPNPSVKAA
jgi:hypothetical protein